MESTNLSKNLNPMIQLIDKLKDCGIEETISLPKIVVVGSQSSGKSSLLESIVGLDFLPRGEGVVTRRPLELRLIYKGEKNFKMYAEFLDKPDVQYTDFKEVRKQIIEKTNEKAGTKQMIIDDPIILTVYTSMCPTLTLIDLPGITRVPTKNSDQPKNIEEITLNLARRFIKDERTIILCVIPANNDISTSDALKLAQEVDPYGKRTLGVLTKVDIIDRGTTILPILQNDIIHLSHGYVAVKNRSQEDIKKDLSVEKGLEEEKAFFKGYTELNDVSELLGTQNLSNKLSNLLHSQILYFLPKIEDEIDKKIQECGKELQDLGDGFPKDKQKKLKFLLLKAKELSEKMKDIMNGNKSSQNQEKTPFNVLFSQFADETSQSYAQTFEELDLLEVIEEIIRKKGFALPGLLPKELLFERIREQLNKMNSFSGKKIKEVKSRLAEEVSSILNDMKGIPSSSKRLLQKLALKFLEQQTKKTHDFVGNFFAIEKDMIWTCDHDHWGKEPEPVFAQPKVLSNGLVLGNSNSPINLKKESKVQKSIQNGLEKLKISTVKELLSQIDSSERDVEKFSEKIFGDKKKSLKISSLVTEEDIVQYFEKLEKYFFILNRNSKDLIPKTIGANMMIRFIEDLDEYFLEVLTEEEFDELDKLTEDEQSQTIRARNEDIIKRLKRAREVLKKCEISRV